MSEPDFIGPGVMETPIAQCLIAAVHEMRSAARGAVAFGSTKAGGMASLRHTARARTTLGA